MKREHEINAIQLMNKLKKEILSKNPNIAHEVHHLTAETMRPPMAEEKSEIIMAVVVVQAQLAVAIAITIIETAEATKTNTIEI